MLNANIKINRWDSKYFGWKHYNNILKKAVEQEFPGKIGGLSISLSIAFFIVITSALLLNLIYQSI